MNYESIIPHSKPWVVDADRKAVEAVLRNGMLAKGALVDKFQVDIASFAGSPHSIVQSSGTAALILALRTLKVGPGHNVILPTYVCRSVLEAVLSVGAKAKLCDVTSEGVIDPSGIERLIDTSTKAIIAVHLFGHPCSVSALRMYNIPIIDDACQAFSLKKAGRSSFLSGDLSVLSFHATKCLTTGEGGALITNNPDYAMRAIQLASGSDLPTERCIAPLSDLQAALGLSQLNRYHEFEDCRATLLQHYRYAANKHGLKTGVPPDCSQPFRFTLRVSNSFTSISNLCSKLGICVRRGVDQLLHQSMGLDDRYFPQALNLFESTVSVPFYPALTDQEVERVTAAFSAISTCR